MLHTGTVFAGIYFYAGNIYPAYNIGGSDINALGYGISQQANVWYVAHININPDGSVFWNVYREDDPNNTVQRFSITLDSSQTNSYFANNSYWFGVWTGSGVAGATSTIYLADYQEQSDVSTWLVNLPRRQTTWDGLPNDSDPGKIVNRSRFRYDEATCTTAAALPTRGLLTQQDAYLPGGGDGDCSNDWLTTDFYYGENDAAWWQPTRVVAPGGSEQTTNWLNHTLLSSTAQSDGAITYTTSYAFADPVTPWLLTGITQPNGGQSRYEYDTFGRLRKVFTPDGSSGQPQALPATEYSYHDNALPLYIDAVTVPGTDLEMTTRVFYDAIGRPLQQRQWGLSSDFGIVVTDTEYDGLGQAACQTAAIAGGIYTFNSGLGCSSYDHTTTDFDALGRETLLTAVDGAAATLLYGSRSQYTNNAANQISASFTDSLGRLIAVDEAIDVFSDTFDDPALPGWNQSGNVVVNNGQLLATGDGTYGNGVNRSLAATGDGGAGGAAFSFKVDDANTRVVLALQSGAWDTSNYRRWAINLEGGYLKLEQYEGDAATRTATNLMPAKANTWYRTVLRTSNSPAYFSLLVWEVGNPESMSEIRLSKDTSWNQNPWGFLMQVQTSGQTLTFDDYDELEFYRTRYDYDLQDNLTTVIPPTGAFTTTMAYNELGQKTGEHSVI